MPDHFAPNCPKKALAFWRASIQVLSVIKETLFGTVISDSLTFTLSSLLPTTSVPKLILELDGTKFPLSEASQNVNSYLWTGHGLNWSHNQSVAVKLIELQAPSAPRNLTASAASATSIRLDWTPPSKNGGSDVTGYKIEVSTDGGDNWSTLVADTSSTGTSYTDTGLTTSCTLRTYRVSAINAIGTGTASNEAAAAPHLPPGAPVVPGGHTKLWKEHADGGRVHKRGRGV